MAHFCCFTLGGNLDFSRFPVKSFTTLATGRSIGKTDIKVTIRFANSAMQIMNQGFLINCTILHPPKRWLRNRQRLAKLNNVCWWQTADWFDCKVDYHKQLCSIISLIGSGKASTCTELDYDLAEWWQNKRALSNYRHSQETKKWLPDLLHNNSC